MRMYSRRRDDNGSGMHVVIPKTGTNARPDTGAHYRYPHNDSDNGDTNLDTDSIHGTRPHADHAAPVAPVHIG